MDHLQDRVVAAAKHEELLLEKQENSGLIKQIEPFMKKYGLASAVKMLIY
ncbi:MAG: hypothetical protein IJH43_01845 [Mogibacterium sp.]|nr:hypothetical protein [Mogibacterium sp.]